MGVFNHGHECLGHLEVLMIYLNCFFIFQGGMIVHRTSLMTKKTPKNLLAKTPR